MIPDFMRRRTELEDLIDSLRGQMDGPASKAELCRVAAERLGISAAAISHYLYGVRKVSEPTIRLARLVLPSPVLALRSRQRLGGAELEG